jgi:predicted RNA-binding protein YlxR (DUF448 family)/ribosomal protein L30E
MASPSAPVAKPGSESTRMCIACRRPLSREGSLRFVRGPDGALAHDARSKLSGRGARTCADLACLTKAVKRGAFAKAFKATVKVPDAGELAASIARSAGRRCLELLGLLRRQGGIEPGARASIEAMRAGALGLVVVATDHSERSAAEVARAAGQSGTPLARFSTSEEIGRAVGRAPTGVVGAATGRLADALRADVLKVNMLVPPPAAAGEGQGQE